MAIKAVSFSFIINILLIFVPKSSKSALYEYDFLKAKYPKFEVCETRECMELALNYHNTLDFSYDPCTDFYSFSCGKISEKIEDTRTENRAMLTMDEQNLKILSDLFGSPEIEFPRNVFATAQAYYQGCMKMETLPTEKIARDMTELLKDLGGMPFLSATQFDPTISWQKRAANVYRKLGSSLFAKIAVVPHPESNIKTHMITVQPYDEVEKNGGLLGLSPKLRQIEKMYRQLIRESLCIMRHNECNDEVDQVVDDIFKLETMLVNLTIIPIEEVLALTGAATNNLKSIREEKLKPFLQEIINVFDMKKEEDNKILIVIEKARYFETLSDFLDNTDIRIIANYIGWRVFKMLPGINTRSLKKYLTEVNKRFLGVKVLPPLERACAKETKAQFPFTAARMYVENYVPHGVRDDVQEFANVFRKIFKMMIMDIKWMDEKTKYTASRKMGDIKKQIGYPKWILNSSNLEKLEGLTQPFQMNAYITSVVNCRAQRMKTNTIDLLHEKPDPHRWVFQPVDIQAALDHSTNKLILNVGVLQPPIYHHNTIAAINYGSLGFMLAHELLHSLHEADNQKYNEVGNNVEWWSEKTKKHFQSIMKCFVDMYNITDEKTKLKLDGNQYLFEVTADSGGLAATYQAYMTTNPEDIRLPGLENLSHEQLFFIARGRAFCGRVQDEHRKMFIMGDDHPLDEYRAIIPHKNFKPFADAFGCPEGSPMNPKKRCQFW